MLCSLLKDLPVVAKIFSPSVRCPVCSHANDQDFRFCQRCGYKRKIHATHPHDPKNIVLDLPKIDARLNQLANFDRATSYSKQKDSLKQELIYLFIYLFIYLETRIYKISESYMLYTVEQRTLQQQILIHEQTHKTSKNN